MPKLIADGIAHVIEGVDLLTTRVTLVVAVVKSVVSVGVNVTDKVCVPAPSTVPAAGVYTNVPGTFAVASSCAPLSAVPKVIAAGAVQVTTGVPLLIVSVNVCTLSGPTPLCAVRVMV